MHGDIQTHSIASSILSGEQEDLFSQQCSVHVIHNKTEEQIKVQEHLDGQKGMEKAMVSNPTAANPPSQT